MKINDFNFHISKEIVAYIQPMLALYGIIEGGGGYSDLEQLPPGLVEECEVILVHVHPLNIKCLITPGPGWL